MAWKCPLIRTGPEGPLHGSVEARMLERSAIAVLWFRRMGCAQRYPSDPNRVPIGLSGSKEWEARHRGDTRQAARRWCSGAASLKNRAALDPGILACCAWDCLGISRRAAGATPALEPMVWSWPARVCHVGDLVFEAIGPALLCRTRGAGLGLRRVDRAQAKAHCRERDRPRTGRVPEQIPPPWRQGERCMAFCGVEADARSQEDGLQGLNSKQAEETT
jgi:hypothetical protein